ncbi:hypothetical protein [Rubrimonas sp.]|uniref:PIN-like domain-containing protein n=1 Tax=Rubrimonas sp. TaxID=2036015 RepID=UPI002FDED9F4
MKLIGDEHVSPKIIRAIRDLGLAGREGWTIESVVGSRYASIEDEDWIVAFANDGGRGLLSADREMLQRRTLVQQIAQTGLIAVYLPKKWASSHKAWQASHILFWWPRIVATFESARNGSAWYVPGSFDETQPFREVRPFGEQISDQKNQTG